VPFKQNNWILLRRGVKSERNLLVRDDSLTNLLVIYHMIRSLEHVQRSRPFNFKRPFFDLRDYKLISYSSRLKNESSQNICDSDTRQIGSPYTTFSGIIRRLYYIFPSCLLHRVDCMHLNPILENMEISTALYTFPSGRKGKCNSF
jgi:hypothetical protein